MDIIILGIRALNFFLDIMLFCYVLGRDGEKMTNSIFFFNQKKACLNITLAVEIPTRLIHLSLMSLYLTRQEIILIVDKGYTKHLM